MGRPSKLTEKQWNQITERMAAGEPIRALAREFEVSEAAIRLRLSAQVKEIKSVANQIVATESRLRALPVSAQITTHNLADMLRSISGHLAGAANFGASTAHRLAGIANMKAQEIDDTKPLDGESLEAIKALTAITYASNEASKIGLNLLNANKEAVADMGRGDTPEQMNWTINPVKAAADAS